MKKIFLTLFLAFGCISMTNAQIYVGGTFGFSYSKLSLGEGSKQSGSSFKILPEVGYKINKYFAVGANTGYIKGYAALGSFDPSDFKAFANTIISTVTDITSDDMLGLNLSAFHIAPYVRFSFFESDRFEIFVDGVFGLNFITGKMSGDLGGSFGGSYYDDYDDYYDYDDYDEPESTKMTAFEISLKPGVAFSLNDHLKLIAKVGTFGYQFLKVRDSDITLNRFGLDIDGNNILFGMIYSF